MLSKTQIIILAAGKGKRMGGGIPKVLTLFRGRPIIEYLMDAVSALSLPFKPVVVVGFGAEAVKKQLGGRAVYALQEQQLGTGHAAMSAKDAADKSAENIVVLYGDHPNTQAEAVENLINLHEKERPALTMMVVRVPDFSGSRAAFYGFGRIVRDENGKIKKITELKDASEEEKNIRELNPSLFCFDAKWLWENLSKLQNSNSQGEYYLTDMVGLAIGQGKKISSLEIDPMECVGVNTPEDLDFAEKLIAK
jgi:bifunctional UDP-N-acetylglucosamine pyrophosphorylase / glucosamine-1-phosphate N-acetyltransferase